MHQNQWRAAIEELKADGLEETPVPALFPQSLEVNEVSYKFMSFSEGEESAQGRWASGPSMDGKGQIEYVASPQAMGPEMDELDPPVEPRLYSTPKQPMPRPLPDQGRRSQEDRGKGPPRYPGGLKRRSSGHRYFPPRVREGVAGKESALWQLPVGSSPYRLASPFGISVGTASLDTSRAASPTASS